MFTIQLEEPCLENYFEPPEDPLGELSEFEIGLARFCFEYNHHVSIQIGDESRRVFLFPDIWKLLERLPEKITQLSLGRRIEIEFPDNSMEINFIPVDDKINCIFRKYGTEHKVNSTELARSQVLEVLGHLLNELIQLAVDRGYIKPEEAHEFLKTG